jgi:hypothetical protein
MPILDSSMQIAAKREPIAGTPVSLSADDVKLRIYESTRDLSFESNERDSKDSQNVQAPKIGTKSASIKFQTQVHGYGDASTVPAFDDFLEACGLKRQTSQLVLCTTTAGSTGTVPMGVTIDDGAGNSGVVLYQPTDRTKIVLLPLTGTIAAGTYQDPTDSVSVVIAGSPVNCGWAWLATAKNLLASATSLTMRRTLTNKVTSIFGARGQVTLTGGNKKIGTLDFDFQGPWQAVVDTPEFVKTLPDIDPSNCWDHIEARAGGALSAFNPVVSQLTVAVENALNLREDAAAPTGYRDCAIGQQMVKVTADPEELDAATIDWTDTLADGDELSIGAWFGDESGDSAGVCGFYADRVVLTEAGEGTRENIVTRSISGTATGDYGKLFILFVFHPDAE